MAGLIIAVGCGGALRQGLGQPDPTRSRKMAKDQKLQQQFTEIWREWGQGRGATQGLEVTRIIDAMSQWLATGTRQPEVVIRAVQVLMAEPERHGARRSAVKGVLDKLQDVWEMAGAEAQDLQLLQAMVLAVWPQGP